MCPCPKSVTDVIYGISVNLGIKLRELAHAVHLI